jgi:hypothetical protein
MSLPRISIKSLMAFVVLVAVGVTALARPNEGWAIVLSASTFTALLTSLLGAIFRRGLERAGWVGFAIFGWAFFALLFSLHDSSSPGLLFAFDIRFFLIRFQEILHAVTSLDGKELARLLGSVGYEDAQSHGWLAFSLMDLMFALLGARIARSLYRREGSGEM